MKNALAIGIFAAISTAYICHAQAPAKKPSLAEERINNYQNPLNRPAKPGAQTSAPGAKGSAPEPVQGHVFALWELREQTDKLVGQIVRVKIQPTILRPEQLPSGDYRGSCEML